MCQIWKIIYTCKHKIEVKRSTCRGIIKNTKVVKFDEFGRARPSSSACIQEADMYFLHNQECGPCTLQHLEEELDEQIQTIMLRIAPHSSRETRLAAKRQIIEIEKRKIEARMTIPKLNWTVPEIVYPGRKPGQSRSKERRTGTLLKREVQPEDVCGDEMYDTVKEDLERMSRGWDDKDWGSEFKKLGEELVEDREAAAVSSDEDLEVGCCHNDSSDDENRVDGDSDSSEDDDNDDWYSTLPDPDDLDNAADTPDTDEDSAPSTSHTDLEIPDPSESTYTTPSTISSMTASHTCLNGPHDTVSPSTETCNPITRAKLTVCSTQQIASTSIPNVDKENGVRSRSSGEEKQGGEEKQKTKTEGGLKIMAMQVVTL